MPAAVILFKYNFLKVFITSVSGGVFGTITSTYISAAVLKWWDNYKEGKPSFKKRKVFTKTNRRIIRLKQRFGLTGIAILSPILLSIPLGAFLGERFYKDKGKVIIYLSISVILWSVTLYGLFYLFHDQLKGWLI